MSPSMIPQSPLPGAYRQVVSFGRARISRAAHVTEAKVAAANVGCRLYGLC